MVAGRGIANGDAFGAGFAVVDGSAVLGRGMADEDDNLAAVRATADLAPETEGEGTKVSWDA